MILFFFVWVVLFPWEFPMWSLELLFRAITKCSSPRSCCLSGSVLAPGDGISQLLNGNSSNVTSQRNEIQVDTLWPKLSCIKRWNCVSRQARIEWNFNLCSTLTVARWNALEVVLGNAADKLGSWNLLLGQPGSTGTAPAQSQHKWRHGVGKIS